MDGQVTSIKEITGKSMRLIPIVVSVTQHRWRGRDKKGEELDGEASDESLSKRVYGGIVTPGATIALRLLGARREYSRIRLETDRVAYQTYFLSSLSQ